MAIVAVLVHAMLIVWHNAAMLQARFDHQLTLAALTQMCHTPARTTSGQAPNNSSDVQLPILPSEGDAANSCPICKGMLAMAIVVPERIGDLCRPARVATRFAAISEAIAERTVGIWPPPRGPPGLT